MDMAGPCFTEVLLLVGNRIWTPQTLIVDPKQQKQLESTSEKLVADARGHNPRHFSRRSDRGASSMVTHATHTMMSVMMMSEAVLSTKMELMATLMQWHPFRGPNHARGRKKAAPTYAVATFSLPNFRSMFSWLTTCSSGTTHCHR